MPNVSSGCYNLDENDTIYRAGTFFDFSDDSLLMKAVDTFVINNLIAYPTIYSVSQICNKDGELVAYFNGSELWDRHNEKIQLDVFFNDDWNKYSSSFGFNNSVMLPFPGIDSVYIFICANDFYYDDIAGVPLAEDFTAVSFREKNNGRLEILNIMPEIHKDKYVHNGAITANRHANGRDWWLIAPERRGKVFNIFLLDINGIYFHHKQTMKTDILDFSYTPIFSPDGQWYTRTETKYLGNWKYQNAAQLFKFDRCAGLFTEEHNLVLPIEDSVNLNQVIFDRTSTYYYLMRGSGIYQGKIGEDFKLENIKQVGSIDYDLKDANGFHVLMAGFLAPDDKIYIMDANNNFRSSVIHYPSEEGLACGFEYAGLVKPSCTGMSLGNMPDFNLGPLDGSPCDTLGLDNPASVTGDIVRNNVPVLYPNPAGAKLYGRWEEAWAGRAMSVYDFAGKKVWHGKAAVLRSGLDIGHLSTGVYFVAIQGLKVQKVIRM